MQYDTGRQDCIIRENEVEPTATLHKLQYVLHLHAFQKKHT